MPVRSPLRSGAIGVLVVEDEPLLMMDTADVFTAVGMEAFEARDADAALTILSKRGDINVLITDLAMPLGTMDGRDLIRVVAERWPDIRVLVLSGADTPKPGDLPNGVRFLPKPYRGQDLVSAVFAAVSQQTGSI